MLNDILQPVRELEDNPDIGQIVAALRVMTTKMTAADPLTIAAVKTESVKLLQQRGRSKKDVEGLVNSAIADLNRQKAEKEAERAETENATSYEHFWAYLAGSSFICTKGEQEHWPANGVNKRLPMRDGMQPSDWLGENRAVDQLTWAPGMEEIIENVTFKEGRFTADPDWRIYNLYRPPVVKLGDASKADRWINHVRRLYPAEADHIIAWFAHRVQRPGEKINHALVLGGYQGIGKDTLLEGVLKAVGPHNVHDVSPTTVTGRFNGFLKSVILRVSEARDLGGTDRYKLYEHMKTIIAAPPDVHRIDEKHIREYAVPNVCGVIFTTNSRDGLYLPTDDRRHFVAWSETTKEDFSEQYWVDFWQWYDSGGYGHVASFLHAYDLSAFNPKAPPPQTAAFRELVASGMAPEDADLYDLLESLDQPCAVMLQRLQARARFHNESFAEWLEDRRNARLVPKRFEAVGYVKVLNPSRQDGRWTVNGKHETFYAKLDLSPQDRMKAVQEIIAEIEDKASSEVVMRPITTPIKTFR